MSNAQSQRAEYPWFLFMPTRWVDNDQYGHMNNAVYYSVFENALMRWMEVEQGFDLSGSDVKCFTVENGCCYHASARYPDTLEVGLRVARVGNTSVRYELGIFIQDRDSVAATGFIVDVFVDAETERPITIPHRFRKAYNALLVSVSGPT